VSKQLQIAKAVLAFRPFARGYDEHYVTHQLVTDLIRDPKADRYLYRVLRARPGGVEVLVLGNGVLPAIDVPIRPYGAVVDVQAKPYAPVLKAGMELDFEVRLNATRSVDQKRIEVWDAHLLQNPGSETSAERVYHEFLARKLAGAADIVETRLVARSRNLLQGGTGRRPIAMATAEVAGGLVVRDPEALLAILAQGVGRSKAFGCGLLCLSKPGTVLHRRAVEEVAAWSSPAAVDTEISPDVGSEQEVIHGSEAKAVHRRVQAGSRSAGE
jgi:CRISPR-associated protein Cas6/Cse3/CasE subtype I-E